MEKLVKLLNEYHFSGTECVGYFLDEDENRIYFRTKVVDKGLVDEQRISDERIISKKFGFIKWLVDNDKINIDEYREEYSENNLYCNSDFFKLLEYYDVYESLLMTLAISDTPIQDLCVWLK